METVESKGSLDGLRQILSKVNLPDLVKTAKVVNEFVPSPAKEVVNTIIVIMDMASGIVSKDGSRENVRASIANTKSNQGGASEREIFDRMLEIALSDGIVTDEEKNILRPQAQKAGLSEGEMELLILNGIKK